ncbi:16645_t:CDS:2 [Funneliformis geosporum]|uniref:16645_t:CDS:1 n=1 Tax=Funneliformis geosporum TaxID=1117311 RepID=A0A9W4WTQ6_9GLOM|nr:16645_t:CDS:2 [Funneliformis geosporum]
METESVENIKKKIAEKEEQIREIWEEIRTEKERPREEIVEELKGIKRTTGQHPGGLLITLPNTDIQNFLSEIFLKVDILGHDEPTVLQKLFQLTGVDPTKIAFHDKNIMQLFTSADTLGIPEFGTDFVKRNLLTPLKPTKFSQLVQISGVDNKNAFIATEFIRKDPTAITFRLDKLLGSLDSYKNSEKELLSIIKVFEELNKEKRRMEKTSQSEEFLGSALKKMDIDKILASIQEKINNSGDKKLLDSFRKNVVLEMEMKGLKFARGLDFNNSEIKDFKIENNTIYFPFTAIAGIGEKLADKIIAYRQEKGQITSH